MSSEEIIRDIAVFFYYVFNDEEYAFQCSKVASQKCLKRVHAYKKKEGSIPNDKVRSLVVYYTEVYFNKFYGKRKKKALKDYNPAWFIKEDVDQGIWKEFLQKADSKNLKSLVWSRILKYNDSEISLGIGSSMGSIRFRISKALRGLGELSKSKS